MDWKTKYKKICCLTLCDAARGIIHGGPTGGLMSLTGGLMINSEFDLDRFATYATTMFSLMVVSGVTRMGLITTTNCMLAGELVGMYMNENMGESFLMGAAVGAVAGIGIETLIGPARRRRIKSSPQGVSTGFEFVAGRQFFR